MKKYAIVALALITVGLFAPAVFAAAAPQGGEAPSGGGGVNWVAISGGFSMAIASAACGIAQAKASAGASEGMARNPGAIKAIQNMLILALVLIESMALYTFANLFIRVK